MSASNKKKLRKQEAEAQMTNRQKSASQANKKQKRMTVTFWTVMVLCLCIALGTVLANPFNNLRYRNKVVATVGGHDINAVEMNYFYVDAINTFYSQNKNYISYFMSTTTPLNEQVANPTTGQTWADYFVQQAYASIKSTYALYDAAMAANYALTDADKASIDNAVFYMEFYASVYGFKDVDAYLEDMYGHGANEKSYREYYEKCLVAQSYYTKYAEDLEYDAEDLDNYQQDKMHEFNSYTFASYYLAVNRFYPKDAGTKGEDGKTTYSKEEIAAAVDAARKAAETLANGEYADLDAFDKAINELGLNLDALKNESNKDETNKDETNKDETNKEENNGTVERTGDATEPTESVDPTDPTDPTEPTDPDENPGEDDKEDDKEEDKEEEKLKYQSTKNEDVLYSGINTLFRDWVSGYFPAEKEEDEPKIEIRKEGDLYFVESSSGTGDDKVINGFWVIRYGSSTDNDFAMKNVRHILVKFTKLDANGKPVTSTSNSTNTSYTDKEKEYAKTEAEKLLKQWQDGDATEDTFAELANKESDDGDGTTGGLYENVYPGQMVEAFENWCFAEERKTGDVEIIETEYGYHIMYFVSNTEQTFRDHMITETIRAEDVEAWYNDLIAKIIFTPKTEKFIDKEMTIA